MDTIGHEPLPETLRRIRAETAANRDGVRRVVDYHVKAQQQLKNFFAAPAAKRGDMSVGSRAATSSSSNRRWQSCTTTCCL